MSDCFERERERRKFTNKQKASVELVAGAEGEHADHIVPYSKGGPTSVENCQLISPSVNRKKGAFNFVPRRWQRDFFKAWEGRNEDSSFLLIAIPGGGKTLAAIDVCRRWMFAGADRRMIIVVPTVNLQQQWDEEANKMGVSLQTNDFGVNFKDGFKGGVVTYQTVAGNILTFRKLCSVAPTMVVFDEIHHCGDDAHFGIGIKESFRNARERLLLSGTPWKTDGTPLPFVRYDGNGMPIADFIYDYPQALDDQVVRYLAFDYSAGAIQNDITGNLEEVRESITDKEAQGRLRRLLNPNGDYVKRQIELSHRKLVTVRQSIPDAAAMAVCIDVDHAKIVAGVIRSVTGCRPDVIVSDPRIETRTVPEFRRDRNEWLVSVKKVSEGTDIKRLQVLSYLTNVTSELAFRQLIGRVSRFRDIDDYQGYVFLPSDPRLVRCAKNIENAQLQALREQSEREARELGDRDKQKELDFDSYSTIHNGTEVSLVGSNRIPIEKYRRVERLSEAHGIPMQKVINLMADLDLSDVAGSRIGDDIEQEPQEKTMQQRVKELRKKCGKKAFRLSKLLGCEVEDIHMRFKRQNEMGEEELKAKLDTLIRECEKAAQR